MGARPLRRRERFDDSRAQLEWASLLTGDFTSVAEGLTMLEGLQGIGWFLRRARNQERLAAFYRDVVGLPILRCDGSNPVFWLGETLVMGMGPLRTVDPLPQLRDASEAPRAILMRVADIDAAVQQLVDRDVRFVNEPFPGPNGREAYFLDPEGNVTGIVQCEPSGPFPEDAEAAVRWHGGQVAIPSGPAMPPGWQNVGRVVLRCADIEGEVAFYRDVLGLTERLQTPGRALFSLGETCLLEIGLGASARPVPADRMEVSNGFVFRVADVERAAAELTAKGVPFVNPPFDIGGGRVGYFADPEGHLLGIQQRWPTSQRVEDVEARRRLAQGQQPV